MQIIEQIGLKLIKVPALSNAYPISLDYKPPIGFLDVTFKFDEVGEIYNLYFKNYIFHYGMNLANEAHLLIKDKTKNNIKY